MFAQVTDLALSTAAFQEEIASVINDDEDDDDEDGTEGELSSSNSSNDGNSNSSSLSYALTLMSHYSKARKQRMRKWKRVFGVSEEMVLDAKVKSGSRCNLDRGTHKIKFRLNVLLSSKNE